MKTIKGTKKNIIKEYLAFCKDYKLVKEYIASKEFFIHELIENEIRMRGFFHNDFFKTVDINEIQNELLDILLHDKKCLCVPEYMKARC